MIICGTPEAPVLIEAISVIWSQLPGPRARCTVNSLGEVESALDGLAADYTNRERQRGDAASRTAVATEGERPVDHGSTDHEEMDHGSSGSSGTDDHDSGHGGHEMSGPGGIALASGERDIDGLEMDVLHLRLGPVLPYWPSGLVAWLSLQGDTVTGVEAEVIEADLSDSSPTSRTAWRLDAALGVLTLAGADRPRCISPTDPRPSAHRGCRRKSS